MGYRIEYLSDAQQHLLDYKKAGNKFAIAKIKRIEDDLKTHPKTGIGNPEPLKHNYSGFWSREIDKKTVWSMKLTKFILLSAFIPLCSTMTTNKTKK
jgi:toxin YoeB